MDNRPIGFMDSGLGGLTCIPELHRKCPRESIIYLGDTARTPYGSKEPRVIRRFAFEMADMLADAGAKMIVIPCNTISSTCIEDIRRRHRDIPVIGVVEPTAARVAGEEKGDRCIGLIGTRATVVSRVYDDTINAMNGKIRLVSRACPALVPLIEEGIVGDEIMDLTIRYYLDDLIRDYEIEKLILGCTHYSFIRGDLGRLYPGLETVDPSRELSGRVEEVLRKRNMKSEREGTGIRCLASDLSENFTAMIDMAFSGISDLKAEIGGFDTGERE